MFKVKLEKQVTYQEMPQTNPLRWKILFLEGKQFVDQTGWIACKDFFNDSVAWFQVQNKFSVYRYSNDIKKNDEGVYVFLKNIKERATFLHNIEVINERLMKEGFGPFNTLSVAEADVTDTEIVLCIPTVFWETTYRISMLCMAIRCCNYGVKYDTWEDFWTPTSPAVQLDRAFTPQALKCAQGYGFTVPAKYQDYWYYCSDKYNSKTTPEMQGTVIHDNGVCAWANSLVGA